MQNISPSLAESSGVSSSLQASLETENWSDVENHTAWISVTPSFVVYAEYFHQEHLWQEASRLV
jgi:hypothetical protein